MDRNIEILLYIAIGLIELAAIVIAVYLFDKKTKYDNQDNELVLRADYLQIFIVGIISYGIAYGATELISLKVLRLFIIAVIAIGLPLLNMFYSLKTFYLKESKIIVYRHFDKKTVELSIENVKGFKRIIGRWGRFPIYQFGISYYYPSINDTYTTYYRGVSIDDEAKLKKYFEAKNITYNKLYRQV